MDQHTESGWKHDPTAPREKCEMNFRNNLTTFSWKEFLEAEMSEAIGAQKKGLVQRKPIHSRTSDRTARYVRARSEFLSLKYLIAGVTDSVAFDTITTNQRYFIAIVIQSEGAR